MFQKDDRPLEGSTPCLFFPSFDGALPLQLAAAGVFVDSRDEKKLGVESKETSGGGCSSPRSDAPADFALKFTSPKKEEKHARDDVVPPGERLRLTLPLR